MSCWVKKKRVDKTTLNWNRRYFELSGNAISYYASPQVCVWGGGGGWAWVLVWQRVEGWMISSSIANVSESDLTNPLSLSQENPLGSMPLSGVEICDERDGQLRLKTKNREYSIIFESGDLCKEWVTLVRSLQLSLPTARQTVIAT